MNTIDIILSIFLIMGFLRGFFKGFLTELAGIIALVAGVYGAMHFSDIAFNFLNSIVSWEREVLSLVSFALTFIVIVVIISMLGGLLTKMVSIIALGLINRLLGGVFGLLKWAFLASLVFMFLNQSDSYSLEEETVRGSFLYQPIEKVAPMVLPTIIRELKEGDFFDAKKDTDSELTLVESV